MSIAHSLLEKEKTSVTSPMKVTIGPETIVITNLCHYRHFHHHHIPLWVMEASKLWIFCFEGEEKKRGTSMEENQIYTRNTTVFDCLNLTCKIYWLRWTKMGLCSPLDMSGKSSKYRPGLWDFFGVTRETLGNSESTAKDRAVSLFHVHFIPAWHHHLHLTICQPSSPQHCHHHQIHHHVPYWNQCFMEKSIRHWFVTIYLLWILWFLGLLRLLLQDEVSLALCGSDFLSITRWWIAQQLRHK